MKVEFEVEEDGRFIAEVPSILGAMVYGSTAKEAISEVEALDLHFLAERLDSGEDSPEIAEACTLTASVLGALHALPTRL